MKLLSKEQKYTRKRILEVSFSQKLSHIGSCLSVIDIIDTIYKQKKADEYFILSNGHAGIALYVVLEKYGLMNSLTIPRLNIHPDRNPKLGIDVSTGSLGQGLPIAAGLAISNRHRNVFCTISDGECAEGSIWETLRVVVEQKLSNLKIVVNANGWGAYQQVSFSQLKRRLQGFIDVITVDGHDMRALSRILLEKKKYKPRVILARTRSDQFPFLKGQEAHYYTLKKRDYKLALATLS